MGPSHTVNGKVQVNLVTSPCFIVDKFKLSNVWEFRRPRHARRSVWCMIATRGYGVIESHGVPPLGFSSGEAVVVPAAVDRFVLKPQWEVEFLCASLPVEKVEEPPTLLSEAAIQAT